jgi:hypothetical protein
VVCWLVVCWLVVWLLQVCYHNFFALVVSNANHELCHHTDDVMQHSRFDSVFQPAFTVFPATRIYVYAPALPSTPADEGTEVRKVNVQCTNDGKTFSKGRHVFTYL